MVNYAFITNTLQSEPLHFLIILLFLLTPYATPLTFNFSSFADNQTSISIEGDAEFYSDFLPLTVNVVGERGEVSVGRATYHQPFLLRENSTGKLADFNSTFSFSIDSQGNSMYRDGLAFFIAPNGSLLNTELDGGSSLGLPFDSSPSSTENRYPFVAIEFDIFQNVEPSIDDPPDNHVGIDANSLNSLTTKAWNASILQASENTATVTYNSTSKKLCVSYTTFVDDVNQGDDFLDYTVDLIDYLSHDWVVVGFSASAGAAATLFNIYSWSFNSTSLGDHPKPGKNNKTGLIIGLSAAGACVLLGVLGLVWFILRKKSKPEEHPRMNESIGDEFEKSVGPRKFTYSELARATNNFENKLGEGGFGGVYKGYVIDLQSDVAVKKLSTDSDQGLKEYTSEVTIISRLRHRNLVQLIGWCHDQQFLLVYDYMPNRSLDSHLFNSERILTWEERYKIARGLADGLFYLQRGTEQCVLHRDIKSSNVMLDSDFNAKLGDFGLARLVDHGKESQKTAVLFGTQGYMAPEYLESRKASKESDVYSFGVVALEISCGRFVTNRQVNLVEWVWKLYGEERVTEAADRKLSGDFDEKQMECLMIVGLWCAHPDYNVRPSMHQAIQVLNFEVPLPDLRSKMPVVAPLISLPTEFSNARSYEGGQTESSGNGSNSIASQFTASSSGTHSQPSISLGR